MNWFNKLERKYGKYAISNLMYYIIVLYVIGFVVDVFFPTAYDAYLSLEFSKILQGQVWRLVTFIIQPPSTNFIFVFFALYFYYMIGSVLERIWGAFKFNVYFISGVLLNIIAALIIYLVWHIDFSMSTSYINLALFMAFAFEQPDMEVLLFFIIPIKIKWLGILDGIIFAITIIGGFLVPFMPMSVWYGFYSAGLLSGSVLGCYVNATAALVSMLNFIIFLIIFKKGPSKTQEQRNFNKAMKTAAKAKKNKESGYGAYTFNSAPADNSKNEADKRPQRYNKLSGVTKHRCAVCNRTENDGDDLVFRFCSKCDGAYEYCQDHLYTHIHVTKN